MRSRRALPAQGGPPQGNGWGNNGPPPGPGQWGQPPPMAGQWGGNTNAPPPQNNAPLPSGGRGRGRTVPAWMAKQQGN